MKKPTPLRSSALRYIIKTLSRREQSDSPLARGDVRHGTEWLHGARVPYGLFLFLSEDVFVPVAYFLVVLTCREADTEGDAGDEE